MRISDWSSDVCSSDLQPHQFARVVVAVVLPFEHHIFKGDAPRTIGTGIGGAGGQQLLDAVFLVDGHDLVAHLLRSEEHTSELQSLMRISYAVFCLKNKK